MTIWPRTLLWQLCIALVGIQIIVALGFGWCITRHVKDFHREQTRQELSRLYPVLADRYHGLTVAALHEELAHEDSSLQRTVARDGQAERGLRITIVAADGRVLADSMQNPQRIENHRNRPEIAAALAEGTGQSVRFSNTVNREMIYLAVRRESDAGRYVLRTSLVLDTADAGLIETLRVLALGGVFTLGLTGGLFYLVSRRVSRSVTRIADGLGEQGRAAAETGISLAEPPVRELSPIVTALNDLSRDLHQRIMELSRRQREHEAILQSMNSGVVALDREHRIISINLAAAKLFNLDPESVRQRLVQEVIRHPAVHRHIRDSLEQKHDAAAAPTAVAEFRIRSEPPAIVELTSSRLTDGSGRTTGLLLVFNNVTELRRLESIRSDFAANVSHELRTPITNIKGYIETMLEVGTDDAEQVRGFLGIVKRNADRLAAIIEDILSLAWLEQPGTRQTLELQTVSVPELLAGVVSDFADAANAKEIGLTTDAPDPVEIQVNRPLIEQALANYISNAIKYSPTGTQVSIHARPRETDAVEIAVIDQGPGIGREHLNRIFERFYRVDKARSRELGGTGLGLAIVKHIALVHGGRVEADSELDKGSTFKLILPRHPKVQD